MFLLVIVNSVLHLSQAEWRVYSGAHFIRSINIDHRSTRHSRFGVSKIFFYVHVVSKRTNTVSSVFITSKSAQYVCYHVAIID
jgi:hypothetical protein